MPSRKDAPAAAKKVRQPARASAQPATGDATAAAAQPAARKRAATQAPAATKAAAPTQAAGKAPVPGRSKGPKAMKAPKTAKAPKPAKPAAVDVPAPEAKAPKQKLVRDSFTIPRGEYQQLDALKQRLVTLLRPTKKSELLRAGIKLLASLPDDALLAAVSEVPAIKTGRPGKS